MDDFERHFLGVHFEIQSVVACVDALNAREHLTNNEAKEQIVFADSVLLTKTDLQNDSAALTKLKERIQALNPSAEIFDKRAIDYESLFFHAKIGREILCQECQKIRTRKALRL